MNGNDHGNYEYVGFWPRVGAYLLDAVIISAIIWPVIIIYYGEALQVVMETGVLPDGTVPYFYIFWASIFPVIAIIWFWSAKQATPGKMALKAKIVDARSGSAPTIGQCIGRFFGYILSWLVFGLGIIWVAFDARKQGWHDKMAGTVVIRQKVNDKVEFLRSDDN